MSLTASLIICTFKFCFVSQLQGLLTLALSLFPEAAVWVWAHTKKNKRTNERRGYLSLLLSLFFSAFTGTPCFVSQRATMFPFRSASKCLSSLLYSLSTWHSLIKVWTMPLLLGHLKNRERARKKGIKPRFYPILVPRVAITSRSLDNLWKVSTHVHTPKWHLPFLTWNFYLCLTSVHESLSLLNFWGKKIARW